MSRKLFTQLRNEWRTNIWLAVELLIVSVVMWYVVDYFYVTYSQYVLPRGFNIDHTYLLTFNELTDKSPDFNPDLCNPEKQSEAKREILARLSRRPEVEAVSLSQNSYPYNGSNSGLGLRYDTMYSEGYLLRRWVTPDFVRVFRYEGVNGETPEQLAQILREGKFLASDNVLSHYGDVKMRDYVGKKFWLSTSDDTVPNHVLGAAIVPVRYHDYTIWNKTLVINIENDVNLLAWSNEVCIRVKDDMDKNIIENLMADAQKQFHVGNFLLVDVRSFEDIRRNYQRINTNDMRNMYAGLGFLMLNIFLGLFGTFWFRTRQRVHEIAIRKVNGATDGSIFRRLICEGLLLLIVVTPLTVGLDFAIGYFEFTEWYNGFVSASRLAVTAGISFLLMALMIVAGIYIPARKAMKIDPAIALKDE